MGIRSGGTFFIGYRVLGLRKGPEHDFGWIVVKQKKSESRPYRPPVGFITKEHCQRDAALGYNVQRGAPDGL